LIAAAPEPGNTLLPLQACSVSEHCRGLREIRQLPFWWYQGVSRSFGNYSLPFEDRSGNWWYQVKPGLCWPVDFLRPIDTPRACPTFAKSFLGYQHVVQDETAANSHLVINVVQDISTYGLASVDAKRRNAIRKGLKCCTLSVARELDSDTLDGCRAAWDELTRRTGWKKAAEPGRFAQSWGALLNCPGVSILLGRDVESGSVVGFLVVKIIGDTAYVDTIASRSDFLGLNVNDALIFTFVCSAARLPGVRKAHYAIKSTVGNLERFKTSIGFEPVPFPALSRFRPLVGTAMRVLRPADYRRMVGRFSVRDGAK
jgi:hypothetical protein